MVLSLPVLSEAPRPAAPIAERAGPRSVRISVTDRCDMACLYCRPSMQDGYVPAADRLDPGAWERLVRALVAQGVRRVRITGGEPLLFRGLLEVIARVRAAGIDDLALTTNGSRLASLASALRSAGLRRITVSIDSLDPARFAEITRGGALSAVLAGVDAALDAGFDEVKTNTVVLRGRNDDELEAITRWAWARGITPRFIEVMAVGEGARIAPTHVVGFAEMRARLGALLMRDELPRSDPDRGPARYVRSACGSRRVGFITGTTDTFCEGCDRLRASSTGVLRACLSKTDGVDVSDAARAGDARAISEGLAQAWASKPDGRWKGCTEPTAREVNMRGTGG
jgi:cyclic pyranopterin phosphate synthase